MSRAQRLSDPRAIRQRLGLNQQDFWGQIGVTQSGGSRYESGREMPKPVQELLRLVHVDRLNLRNVTRIDLLALAHLKKSQPKLYRKLKAEAMQGTTHNQRHRRART
ncbi:MAG: XRE family transcriptional regulator [Betaproteobacteria bacterium SG8_40]|nr:MAG: XRE family transcriptional regulator [Betaproteobacteria bacterium SG8_40]